MRLCEQLCSRLQARDKILFAKTLFLVAPHHACNNVLVTYCKVWDLKELAFGICGS